MERKHKTERSGRPPLFRDPGCQPPGQPNSHQGVTMPLGLVITCSSGQREKGGTEEAVPSLALEWHVLAARRQTSPARHRGREKLGAREPFPGFLTVHQLSDRAHVATTLWRRGTGQLPGGNPLHAGSWAQPSPSQQFPMFLQSWGSSHTPKPFPHSFSQHRVIGFTVCAKHGARC